MASKFMRRRTWWLKFQNPTSGKIQRVSLETPDPARAKLLRERLELEVTLLAPRFQAVEVPEGVRRLVPTQMLDSVTSETPFGPLTARANVCSSETVETICHYG